MGNQGKRASLPRSPPKRNLIIGSRYCGADCVSAARPSWVPAHYHAEKKLVLVGLPTRAFEAGPTGSPCVSGAAYSENDESVTPTLTVLDVHPFTGHSSLDSLKPTCLVTAKLDKCRSENRTKRSEIGTCPVTRASSTGRRNTFLKFTR